MPKVPAIHNEATNYPSGRAVRITETTYRKIKKLAHEREVAGERRVTIGMLIDEAVDGLVEAYKVEKVVKSKSRAKSARGKGKAA